MNTSLVISGSSDAPVLQDMVNRSLSGLQSDLRYVPRSQRRTAFAAPVAGEPFNVSHSLGRVPESFLAMPYEDMRVWATEADRQRWTERTIVLRASEPNVKLDVHIRAECR